MYSPQIHVISLHEFGVPHSILFEFFFERRPDIVSSELLFVHLHLEAVKRPSVGVLSLRPLIYQHTPLGYVSHLTGLLVTYMTCH